MAGSLVRASFGLKVVRALKVCVGMLCIKVFKFP